MLRMTLPTNHSTMNLRPVKSHAFGVSSNPISRFNINSKLCQQKANCHLHSLNYSIALPLCVTCKCMRVWITRRDNWNCQVIR